MSQIVMDVDFSDCNWCILSDFYLAVENCPMKKEWGHVERGEIHPECPLKFLSPHGRLIDADALQEHYEALDADNGSYTEDASETAEAIANAPTILEGNR